MFKLPKVVLPGKVEEVKNVVFEIKETIALIRQVVAGFKDGVGVQDIERCGLLATRLLSLVNKLDALV